MHSIRRLVASACVVPPALLEAVQLLVILAAVPEAESARATHSKGQKRFSDGRARPVE
jgi:hypothetical protein